MNAPPDAPVAAAAIGWDHPATVHFFEAFCERHDRYRLANELLIGNAQLSAGQNVLDLAAGTGRTAEIALSHLGADGRVLCAEPARAMRLAGMSRCRDPRLTWTDRWPNPPDRFDRIVCGAALWQLRPVADAIARLAALLAPGGALAFNIPGMYLHQPDDPGGGRDPLLLELPSLLARPTPDAVSSSAEAVEPLPNPDGIDALLTDYGLRPERWTCRHRLTQEAYRDWLKIPVMTNHLLAGLDPWQRADAIEAAFARSDAASWRWERWLGWTAWAAF